jgi:transposase
VRAALVPPTLTLQAVGVDEWAWRRGRRFSTIGVDLASHRVVELLPERSAETVGTWLARYPSITVVCRDGIDFLLQFRRSHLFGPNGLPRLEVRGIGSLAPSV